MGIKQRIADNTFGDVLLWLVVSELVACLRQRGQGRKPDGGI